MPIQIKAPDGSIAQFPDGMADADIEKVMAQHYPQPSFMDRVAASPVGRFAHDAIAVPAQALISGLGSSEELVGADVPELNPLTVTEPLYQGALGRNRNTPGYAAQRQKADAMMAARGGSGFTDQVMAPLLPTLAGTVGLTGGLDSSNASADAQSAAMDKYRSEHPALSFGAGMLGGLALGGPEGVAARLPVYAGDRALLTRAINPKAMGPYNMKPTPEAVPSIESLKAASRDAYRQVDDAGIRVSTDAVNRLADGVVDRFGVRLDPTLHPDATAALNRVSQYATEGAKGDRSVSFSDLDNLRRIVADAAKSTKPADKAMARMMQDHIDDFVNGLGVHDLDTALQDQLRADLQSATSAKGQVAKQIKSVEQNKPGALAARGAAGADTRAAYMDLHQKLPQAEAARQSALTDFNAETGLINAGPQEIIDALNSARSNWARSAQASLIQKEIEKAAIQSSANYSQSGFENALRQRFKSLALNDRAMARLSPEVQKAVKEVAAGSKSANVLRALGKYAPHGPVATALGGGIGASIGGVAGGLMGAGEGGAVGAVALPAISELARHAATARTLSAANMARDIAALGRRPVNPASLPPLQLPRLQPGGPLPYGFLLPQLQPSTGVSGR